MLPPLKTPLLYFTILLCLCFAKLIFFPLLLSYQENQTTLQQHANLLKNIRPQPPRPLPNHPQLQNLFSATNLPWQATFEKTNQNLKIRLNCPSLSAALPEVLALLKTPALRITKLQIQTTPTGGYVSLVCKL